MFSIHRYRLGLNMTTGSISESQLFTDPYYDGIYKYRRVKSWTGGDRAVVRSPKPPVRVIHREYTDSKGVRKVRVLRIPLMKGHFKPPKRVYDEPHAYSMSDLYLSDEAHVFTRVGGVTDDRPDRPIMGLASGSPGMGSWACAPLLDANDQIRLVNKLKEKINGSDFNMGIVLAESHKTLDMITDSARRIFNMYKHVRRGDLVSTYRVLLSGTPRANRRNPSSSEILKFHKKSLSERVLEVQYGWRPLIQDVHSGAEFLAHQLNVPFQTKVRASVRRESSLSAPVNGGGAFDSAGIVTRKKEHRVSIIAIFSEAPFIGRQLGLLDPLSVIWELTPYSFVADWFIPIGQYLSAINFSSGIKGGKFITSDLKRASLGPVLGSGTRAHYAQVQFNRTLSDTLSVSLPTFKGLDKVASWQHCLNAIALLGARK